MGMLILVGCTPDPDPGGDAGGDGGPADAAEICPDLRFSSPGHGAVFSPEDDENLELAGCQQDIEVLAEGSDGGVVTLLVDSTDSGEAATVSGGVASFDGVTLPEGEHRYEVQLAGAPTDCDWPEITLTVDSTAPVCEVVTPAEGADCLGFPFDEDFDTLELQIDIDVRTSADEEVTVTLEVGEEAAGIEETTSGLASFDNVTLPEGHVTLAASCEDSMGNMSGSPTREIFVDAIPPNCEVVSPSDGDVFSSADDALAELDGVQLEVVVACESPEVEYGEACANIEGAMPLPVFGCATIEGGSVVLYVEVADGTWRIEVTTPGSCGGSVANSFEVHFSE